MSRALSDEKTKSVLSERVMKLHLTEQRKMIKRTVVQSISRKMIINKRKS